MVLEKRNQTHVMHHCVVNTRITVILRYKMWHAAALFWSVRITFDRLKHELSIIGVMEAKSLAQLWVPDQTVYIWIL